MELNLEELFEHFALHLPQYGEVHGDLKIPFVRLTPYQMSIVREAKRLQHSIRNGHWRITQFPQRVSDLERERLNLQVELFKNHDREIRSFQPQACGASGIPGEVGSPDQ